MIKKEDNEEDEEEKGAENYKRNNNNKKKRGENKQGRKSAAEDEEDARAGVALPPDSCCCCCLASFCRRCMCGVDVEPRGFLPSRTASYSATNIHSTNKHRGEMRRPVRTANRAGEAGRIWGADGRGLERMERDTNEGRSQVAPTRQSKHPGWLMDSFPAPFFRGFSTSQLIRAVTLRLLGIFF